VDVDAVFGQSATHQGKRADGTALSDNGSVQYHGIDSDPNFVFDHHAALAGQKALFP
jgi:hypothetical protein